MARADVIDAIEAMYRLEGDDPSWLRAVSEAAQALVGPGIATAAYDFHVEDGYVRVGSSYFPPNVDAKAIAAYVATVPPEYVRGSWLGTTCARASDVAGFEGAIADGLHAVCGARDVLALCGAEPSGRGVWLGALLERKPRLGDARRVLLGRVAAHLATTHRLRRGIDRGRGVADQGEAVLDAVGATVHAEGDARGVDARAELRRAVRALDRARHERDANAASGAWRALVSGRWTLLDQFEGDGKHYVIAYRNAPELPPEARLTEREHQVMAFLALGHSTKLIAYELGLSDATVRVLLHRAYRKLGTTSRAEAIARYRARHPAP